MIEAEALSSVPRQLLASFIATRAQPVPVLIAGINQQTDQGALASWSLFTVTAVQPIHTQEVVSEQVGSDAAITRQLSGSTLPLKTSTIDALSVTPSGATETLIAARFGPQSLPVFARNGSGKPEVFFAAEIYPDPVAVSADPFRAQSIFASVAAPIMFLRSAAGEKAWHSPGNYANFTIDDLWLREPYGHVNYEDLLAHSQQHNFHSTIAFIPWNYDRNHADMVSLFREHPDRLSICVHGNDHIHQEFGPLEDHPLATQTRNIQQSVARMDRFTQLTSIPYDRVMVFPHSISPEKTFAELKRANYLGTVNSLNVPSDVAAPADEEFALRAASLAFANFPSLRRYSAETEIPQTQLAIDAFLGNPMLFYAHESYFANGSNAFDRVADNANQLQPDLQWRSLGEVMQHLYLEKLEDDGSVSVRAYSPSVLLRNNLRQDTIYRFEKEEDFSLPVALYVDGHAAQYKRSGTTLSLELPIPQGETRLIAIHYGAPGSPSNVSLRSASLTAAPIRYMSDFRDNFVSSSAPGRWFIHSYLEYGPRWRFGALLIAVVVGLILLKNQRRRRAGRKPQPLARIVTSR